MRRCEQEYLVCLISRDIKTPQEIVVVLSPTSFILIFFPPQVVMSYLSFLCARLLDLRNETRAARVIQSAWRKYRLKKDLVLYKVSPSEVYLTSELTYGSIYPIRVTE